MVSIRMTGLWRSPAPRPAGASPRPFSPTYRRQEPRRFPRASPGTCLARRPACVRTRLCVSRYLGRPSGSTLLRFWCRRGRSYRRGEHTSGRRCWWCHRSNGCGWRWYRSNGCNGCVHHVLYPGQDPLHLTTTFPPRGRGFVDVLDRPLSDSGSLSGPVFVRNFVFGVLDKFDLWHITHQKKPTQSPVAYVSLL
jgi:hypothetical protein